MKKLLSVVFVAFCVWAVAACNSAPPPPKQKLKNPNVEPVVTLEIPELFSPNPEIVEDVLTIGITVTHPVPIAEWQIQVQPNRRQGGQAGDAERQGRQAGQAGDGERQARQGGQAGDGERPAGARRRGPFYEQSGKGTPDTAWRWTGRGTSGEMLQSATEYLFRLTVKDEFGNTTTEQGIIDVDVLVKKEGDIYKIIVPSIVFPPSSADFSRLTEEEMRGNRRVLNLIGRALNRYPDYKITVEGHSNPLTPPNTPQRTAEERSDMALSEQRARSVVTYLVDNSSVARTRLTAVGRSCTQPVADYEDDDENWKNRRVEFILVK
jgi:outer membrane protein OmpA-like peptidoglycan-associated protein